MTPVLAEIYKIAKKDDEFCRAMSVTDGNFIPGFFADEITKIVFAGIYQGFLLRKIGADEYNTFIRRLKI